MNDRIKDTFDKIHAEDELKNHTKEFLLKKTHSYKKRTFFSYKPQFAIVCFLFLLIGISYTYYTPVITISLDINPSIELRINRLDKVIAADAYNEEGAVILSSLNIYHQDYIDALNKILEDNYIKPYLTKEQLTTITVFGKNQKKCDQMLANVTSCTASYQNVCCSLGRPEEVAKAHEAGLSFGKYRAFLEFQALDPEITTEDVQGLSMRQIRDKIDALSSELDTSDDNTNNTTTKENEQNSNYEKECGYGNGNGNGCGHKYGKGNGKGKGNGWWKKNSQQNQK